MRQIERRKKSARWFGAGEEDREDGKLRRYEMSGLVAVVDDLIFGF